MILQLSSLNSITVIEKLKMQKFRHSVKPTDVTKAQLQNSNKMCQYTNELYNNKKFLMWVLQCTLPKSVLL